MQASNTIDQLRNLFAQQANIELALLIGSRALGQAREESDWDFAVQWRRDIPWGDVLGYTETLRAELARLVQTTQDQIDIVDIPAARLAMRAVIAEEGLLLKGERPCGLTSISRKRRDSRVTKQKFWQMPGIR